MQLFKTLFKYIYELSPVKRKFIRISLDALLIPLAIWASSLFFLEISKINLKDNFLLMIAALIAGLPIYAFSGQYEGLTRYVGSTSFYKLALRNLFLITVLALLGIFFGLYNLSIKKYVLLYLSITLFTGLSRFVLRDLLLRQNTLGSPFKNRVIIYGAGAAGAQLLASLKFMKNLSIIGFIDDEPQLWGRSINGYKIYNSQILKNFEEKVDQVFLAIPSLTNKRRKEIMKDLQKFNLPVFKIPSIEEITLGKADIDNLRPITTEDLLGRESVMPEPSLLGPGINDNVICITGAGGSIGSELCRQIVKLDPKRIVLFENSEPSLYFIEQELVKFNSKKIEIVSILGNATNKELVTKIFIENQIDVVFHAAAYKHVPLVESNPIEGIYNNAFSTKYVCEAAKCAGLKKVILISTDKAVRPTNILGASKRLAELIVQGFAEEEDILKKSQKTIFTMVRFGNVLGSSGSVVPLFEKQIKNGGPITLTHPEVIRYFMTIPEAAQLVIQSAVLASGGEVFLLDMGEPVKIYDLACQMIKLSGLRLTTKKTNDLDIEIIITGLRPGEKLFEELLIDSKCEATEHKLIFKANEKNIFPETLWNYLNDLENELKKQNKEKVFSLMQELIPEWNMKINK